MATNTAGSTARAYHQAQVHYITVNATFANMLTGGAGLKIGTVPAGAIIVRAEFTLSVVFNSGTLNQVGLGLTSAGVTLAALATSNTLGNNVIALAASAVPVISADTDIFLANGYTGTQATTGNGWATVEYILPDSVLV